MGGMAIFSYLDKSRSLTGESNILLLDTCVALTAGLIVFPACFSLMYSRMQPQDLYLSLFRTFSLRCREDVSLGALFFLFLSLQPRPRSSAYSETLFPSGSILIQPKICRHQHCTYYCIKYSCILGFNILSGIQPLEQGRTLWILEDFLVSNNILPLIRSHISYVLYTQKRLGMEQFHSGGKCRKRIEISQFIRKYMTYILPWIVVIIYLKATMTNSVLKATSSSAYGWLSWFAFLLLVFPSHGSKNRPNYNRFYKFALLSADSK